MRRPIDLFTPGNVPTLAVRLSRIPSPGVPTRNWMPPQFEEDMRFCELVLACPEVLELPDTMIVWLIYEHWDRYFRSVCPNWPPVSEDCKTAEKQMKAKFAEVMREDCGIHLGWAEEPVQ